MRPDPASRVAVPPDPVPLAGEMDRLVACVHCGFCLDACPTYTRIGLENDSPRGRLYLMRAVADGRLDAGSGAFAFHLDRCLGCRACEPVCPSGVEYGYLLERSREAIARSSGRPVLTTILLRVFASRTLNAAIGLAGRLLRDTGLAGILLRIVPGRWSRTRFALAMLVASRPWKGLAGGGMGRGEKSAAEHASDPGPAVSAGGGGSHRIDPVAPGDALPVSVGPGPDRPIPEGQGEVTTLRGCVQSTLFRRVNTSTDLVLRANGHGIVEAEEQGCCGALHAHAGDLETARGLAMANIVAFEKTGTVPVVVNSAGCGAMMKDYGRLFEGRQERDRAAGLAGRIVDVFELLDRQDLRRGSAIPLKVAWDAPCHLIHGQRIVDQPSRVLCKTIPELEITPISGCDECCGGAGIHGLTHQQGGLSQILSDKLGAVRAAGADAVITANPGCIMQIGAGLVMEGDRTPVLHPIELVAESYQRSSGAGPGKQATAADNAR